MKKKVSLIWLGLLLSGMVMGSAIMTMPELQKPGSLRVDNGQVFINDGPTVYIYALKEMKLVKKFGQLGEGPQEFKVHPNINRGGLGMSIQPDLILVGSIGKIAFYTRNGDYKNEIKTQTMFGQFEPAGTNYVGVGVSQNSEGDFFTLNFYDPHFNKQVEIFKEQGIGKDKKLNAVALLKFPQFYVHDHLIFINSEDGKINRFDFAGKVMAPIVVKNKNIPVSPERKKRYDDFFQTDSRFKSNYETLKQISAYPDDFPAIRCYVVADGFVYVVTYQEQDGKRQVITYSANGTWVKEGMLPIQEMNVLELYPFTINKGILYQLVENSDSEEWELISMPLK